MHRQIRIADIWSWLPTFRAIAEAESIRGASLRLRVAASSVSRTLKLLEKSLEVPLFLRTGRKLQLGPHGRRLLVSVRDAMRGVDDGVQLITGGAAGEVRVASSATIGSALVIPALASCVRADPTLLPHVEVANEVSVASLLRGDLDLACLSSPVAHSALRVLRLRDLPSSVYCGPGHALYRKRSVSGEEVRAHSFVAPPPSSTGAPTDGWPPQLPRQLSFVVGLLQHGLDLCRAGHALGVFPDVLATGLRRVPVNLALPTPVYVVSRRPLGDGSIVDKIIAALEVETRRRTTRRDHGIS